jgi:sulfopyruvate decarboxylase TPP-binding subunit
MWQPIQGDQGSNHVTGAHDLGDAQLLKSKPLRGPNIISALKQARVEYVLSVPDLHTSQGLLRPISEDPNLRLVRVCKEDECIGIAAGLSYGDKRAVALIQYTGFLYSLNAIRGVAVQFKQPIVMMVGLLGKEPGLAPTESKKYGVRIIEPILDVMGIARHLVETDDDVAGIAPAIEEAYETSRPVALLIGQRPVA